MPNFTRSELLDHCRFAAALLLALLPSASMAGLPDAEPQLITDLSPASTEVASSFPEFVGAGSSQAWFFATTEPEGRELWATDGTPEGTHLVRDIGHRGADWEALRVASAMEFGNRLAFVASEGTLGFEPWASDGSALGTSPLLDLLPGASPSNDNILTPTLLGATSSLFYFCQTKPDFTGRIWVSDGSPAGTHPLDDAVSGLGSACPAGFLALSDGFFAALYRPSGEVDVVRFWNGATTPELMHSFANWGLGPGTRWLELPGGRILFPAPHDPTGVEVWISDGTPAGTTPLLDNAPASSSSSPRLLATCGARGYFLLDDGIHGSELWSTRGTSLGAKLARDIVPGIEGATFGETNCLGDELIFVADDGQHGPEFWLSDGSRGRTRMLADLNDSTSPGPRVLAVSPTRAFLRSANSSGSALWIADGAANGTEKLLDLTGDGIPDSAAPVENGFVFGFDDGSGSGVELWITDGTAKGTGLLLDLATSEGSSRPSRFRAWRQFVAFRANNPSFGDEIWASDGTESGTTRVTDLPDSPPGSGIEDIETVGDRLLFSYQTGLWSIDGEPPVESTILGPDAGGSVLVPFGTGVLYFDGAQERLWWSDGTSAGTFAFWDAPPEASDLFVEDIGDGPKALGGIFFWTGSFWDPEGFWFAGEEPEEVRSLGSDWAPGSRSWQNLSEMTEVAGKAYFAGEQLWGNEGLVSTDGVSTTEFVLNFPGSGFGTSDPNLEALGESLYFTAVASGLGSELWKSDGTAQGSAPLLEIFPGAAGAFPNDSRACRGLLFFIATSPGAGREPWVSDGTAAGTRLLKDIAPGLASSVGEQFSRSCAGGWLLFAANDGEHGTELWATDGTPDGTVRLGDVHDGTRSFEFYFDGGALTPEPTARLLFAGNSGTGFEPWSVSLAAAPFGLFFDGFEEGGLGAWSGAEP